MTAGLRNKNVEVKVTYQFSAPHRSRAKKQSLGLRKVSHNRPINLSPKITKVIQISKKHVKYSLPPSNHPTTPK